MGEIKNQEEFNRYIRQLSPKERCQFMVGIVVDLCNNEGFDCLYRGEETYSLKLGKKRECKRPRILQLKKMLGTK